MKLLAIDTSGPICSAALVIDGAIMQRLQVAPRRHAELILPMMDELLAEAALRLTDLDAVAYGNGPGSFTGVRIAAAVAQGAAFGAGLSVIPVSTLAALAQGGHRVHGATHLLPAFDARMGELYFGIYAVDAGGIARAVTADRVTPAALIEAVAGSGWYGLGSGWGAAGEALRERIGAGLGAVDSSAECEAQDIATLAAAYGREQGALAPQDALPVYLRDRVAVPKAS